MRTGAMLAILVLALTGCQTMKPAETGFLNRSLTIGPATFPYVVYVPREHEPSRGWPVILFLHGAGERGSDGLRQTQVGLGSAIRFLPDRFPAIVVFPQVPLEERWLDGPADAAMLALDRTVREYHVDPARVYLTGLSMGGYGSWHLALQHRERFAGMVVVCGGLLPHDSAKSVRQSPLTIGATDPYAFTAHALRTVPVWLFHGADDTVVPPSESRQMAASLAEEKANFHYTEYPGIGHNAWEKAFGEAELWQWLFGQRLAAGH
jgi:predicted peptidase